MTADPTSARPNGMADLWREITTPGLPVPAGGDRIPRRREARDTPRAVNWGKRNREAALLNRVVRAVIRRATDVRAFVTRRLQAAVTRIGDQTGANAVWLFRFETDGTLATVVSSKAASRDNRIPPHEKSVSGRVARTGRPEFVDLTRGADPDYRHTRVSTRELMSVPLVDHRGTTVGVLTLEADNPGTFGAAPLTRILSEAADLLPDVLVLNAADGVGPHVAWHPEQDGWDLSAVLSGLCHEVRDALNAGTTDVFHCSVWRLDPADGRLSVYATSGAHSEYVAARPLSADGFIGEVCAQPAGGYGVYRPGRSTRFVRPTPDHERRWADGRNPFLQTEESCRNGLCRMVGAPVPLDLDDGPGDGRVAVVVGCYDAAVADRLPGRRALTWIAAELGALVSAFLRLRADVTKAEFRRVRASSAGWRDLWDRALAFTRTVVPSPAGTLLVLDPRAEQLVPVATTGLVGSVDPSFKREDSAWEVNDRPVPMSDCTYPLAATAGFTLHLARRPGQAVRWNYREGPCPGQPEVKAGSRWAEWLPWVDAGDRRLLGIGLGAAAGPATVVLRLVRRREDRPFTPADETLLRLLGEECVSVYRDWVAHQASASTLSPPPAAGPAKVRGGRRSPMRLLSAVSRWVSQPSHEAGSSGAIESLLRDLSCLTGEAKPTRLDVLTAAAGSFQCHLGYRLPSEWVRPGESPESMTKVDQVWPRFVGVDPDAVTRAALHVGEGVMVWAPFLALGGKDVPIRGVLCGAFGRLPPRHHRELMTVWVAAAHRVGVFLSRQGVPPGVAPDGDPFLATAARVGARVRQPVEVWERTAAGYRRTGRPAFPESDALGLHEWDGGRSDPRGPGLMSEYGVRVAERVMGVPLYHAGDPVGVVVVPRPAGGREHAIVMTTAEEWERVADRLPVTPGWALRGDGHSAAGTYRWSKRTADPRRGGKQVPRG